jgi:hypothetical protein
MFYSLKDQMNEIHTQANETEKEHAKKDKQKECWIRELEAEIEQLQEKTDNDNSLFRKKVEDLQCAVVVKENENLDIVRKLGSLEMELKVLSMKNCALEEEVTVSKEVHSLLLKEKENCSEITLNLKKVTEDVENLRMQKLAWDCEKEQLQAKVAEMQNELTLERDIQSKLEKDMMTNVQKVKEENNELQVSYSHLLRNYEMLKGEVNDSHLMKQVHGLNVKDALVRENKENSSSVSENGSCTENLHLRHPFSARVAHSTAEDCRRVVSEKRKLEEHLKICMEEKMAMTNENERLVAEISDLQKKLESCCVEKNSLEISLETLEEEKKKLEPQLSVSHKRLLDAESEVQELKLQIAMRNDEAAAQQNSVLRIKELEAEVEQHKIRKNPLLRESHNAGHNIGRRGAPCCRAQSQLTETVSVLKSSVATNTDISGTLYCIFFMKGTLVN